MTGIDHELEILTKFCKVKKPFGRLGIDGKAIKMYHTDGLSDNLA
jgi:hypothetical protein